MIVVDNKPELRKVLGQTGKTIGAVPTMGALHAGHASLITRARNENDIVVVWLFVNSAQFNDMDDFEKYPRSLEADAEFCRSLGVDILFAPTHNEVYPKSFDTSVTVGALSRSLEGASRPGHFAGVSTIVAKLLNMIHPDRAYFGQKDYQQLQIVRRMVKDLDLPVEIVSCPIIREADGLAM
jgi:pantoate--beta-alanine ligase